MPTPIREKINKTSVTAGNDANLSVLSLPPSGCSVVFENIIFFASVLAAVGGSEVIVVNYFLKAFMASLGRQMSNSSQSLG